MAIYRKGQASMDAQGYITGYDTTWREQLTLIRSGATIVFATSPASYAVISEVISDTQIRAISTGGVVVDRTDYVIFLHDSLTVDGLAQDVAETLRYYQGKESEFSHFIEFLETFDWKKLEDLISTVVDKSNHVDQVAAEVESDRAESEANKNASAQSASESAQSAASSEASNQQSKAQADRAQTIANGIQTTIDSATESVLQEATKQAGIATNKAAEATIEANRATSEADRAKEIANSIDSENLLHKGKNLSDVKDIGAARDNLQVNRLIQSSESTNVASPDASKFLEVKSDSWGLRDLRGAKYIPLGVDRGGTGTDSLSKLKDDMGMSCFIQGAESEWTQIYNSTTTGGRGDWALTIDKNGDFFARNKNNGTRKPLTIGGGGTGANTEEGAPFSLKSKNLSDLTDKGVARDNLGLGSDDRVNFGSRMTLQSPTGEGNWSVVELRGGDGSRAEVFAVENGEIQFYSYNTSGERRRFFLANPTGNNYTDDADKFILKTGDYGIGVGSGSYSTPVGHGAQNCFIGGGNLPWMPGGAGIQSSYGSERVGQLVVRANSNVVFRWTQTGTEASQSDVPWITLQNAGTSDIRFKNVICDLDCHESLDKINNLEFVKFVYKKDMDSGVPQERRGVIAQQAATVDPQYVHSDDETGIQTLDSNPLLMDALASIKYMSKQIEELKIEIESLKSTK